MTYQPASADRAGPIDPNHLEAEIVASRNDRANGMFFFTAQRQEKRWTVAIPHEELSAFAEDDEGLQMRRQLVAAALVRAMLESPDRPSTPFQGNQ